MAHHPLRDDAHPAGAAQLEPHKRKRDVDDAGGQPALSDRIPQPPPPQQGNSAAPINYHTKVNPRKLNLIQGDADTFADVLNLIAEYEGVLSRHESLAANLGAKLTAPRLLKAMEGMFEGPIVTSPPQGPYTPNPVSWMDIVQFARSGGTEFSFTTTASGDRVCHFFLKGVHVEIVEEDWRLIVSGAMDGFRAGLSAQPLEEDETTEVATLDILETRLQVLIKKADEVAKRARQLNYQLSGRKAAINARRQMHPGPGGNFPPVNQARPALTGPGGYDLHADLLQQYLGQSQSSHSRGSSSTGPTHAPVGGQRGAGAEGRSISSHALTGPGGRVVLQNMRAGPLPPVEIPPLPQQPPAPDPSARYRTLILRRIEKMSRGDELYPPCDRCRRLKSPCIKHLTACQGCTRKHAKCSWRTIQDDEIAFLKREASGEIESDEGEKAKGGVDGEAHEDHPHTNVLRTGGDGTGEMGSDDVPDHRETEVRRPSSGGSGGGMMFGGYAMLTEMASVATARADAREAADARDRDGRDASSTSSNTPRR